jgi:hypothetical protein
VNLGLEEGEPGTGERGKVVVGVAVVCGGDSC